jgi:hypothetical protein
MLVLGDKVKELLMNRIGTPLECQELHLSDKHEGGMELSKDVQQTLSLLAGFVKNKRVLLKASPGGILETTSARLQDIKHYTADQDNYVKQGHDIPCSEIMVMAHPDNSGKVWVRTLTAATTSNSWPLAAGEVINFAVDNVRDLRMLIVTDTEKLIVAYTY